MNVGIILAAGLSTRFTTCKQLYKLNGKPVIEYSLSAMSGLDHVIIVTNSQCPMDYTGVHIVTNDINCRLESLYAGIKRAHELGATRIVIHDAARPFITKEHIDIVLQSKCSYSQYCLKLVNGLLHKVATGYEVVDRDQYVELCTPLCIDCNMARDIYEKYMMDRSNWEFIPVLDSLGIGYDLIYGSLLALRKLTFIEDVHQGQI